MDDTLLSIIGIVLAAIIMFLFPLITMADRTDDVSQLTAKIVTTEFAKDVMETGKITPDMYDKFVTNLSSTGNSYNIEMEAKVVDENNSRLSIISSGNYQTQGGSAGENSYYSIFTSQILDKLNQNTANNPDGATFYLKEGDIFSVSVKNSSQTIAQQLKNVFYTVLGKDTYVIAASGGGIVTVTGK